MTEPNRAPAPSMRLEGGLAAEADRIATSWGDGNADAARKLMERWLPYYVVLPDGTNLVCIEFPIYRRSGDRDWGERNTWRDAVEMTDRVGIIVVGWPEQGGPICCQGEILPDIKVDAAFIVDKLGSMPAWARFHPYFSENLAVHLRITDRHLHYDDNGYSDRKPTSSWQPIRLAYRRYLNDRGITGSVCEQWIGFAAQSDFLMHLVRRMRGAAGTVLNARNLTPAGWLALNGEDGGGTTLLGHCMQHPLIAHCLVMPAIRFLGQCDQTSSPEEIFVSCARVIAERFFKLPPGDPAREMSAIRSLLRAERIPKYLAYGLRPKLSNSRPSPFRPRFQEGFAVLRDTPPDWHPRTPEEWTSAFAMVGSIVTATRITGIPIRTLIDPCRGNWSRWFDHVWGGIYRLSSQRLAELRKEDDGYRPEMMLTTGSMLDDVLAALCNQVLLPCLALDDEGKTQFSGIAAENFNRAASKLLFGTATFNGIIQTATDWHSIRHRIDLQIDRLTPEKTDINSWPAGMTEACYDDGRIVVRPLTSHRQLVAEGGSHLDPDGVPGLDHCVGGFFYVERSLKGISRILSIREIDVDGKERRLSTAEINIDHDKSPHFSIRQHYGTQNSTPPDTASHALATYLAELEASAANTDWSTAFPSIQVPTVTLSDRANYDVTKAANVEACLRLWEPLLPKTLRGLPLASFVEIAAAAASSQVKSDNE